MKCNKVNRTKECARVCTFSPNLTRLLFLAFLLSFHFSSIGKFLTNLINQGFHSLNFKIHNSFMLRFIIFMTLFFNRLFGNNLESRFSLITVNFVIKCSNHGLDEYNLLIKYKDSNFV